MTLINFENFLIENLRKKTLIAEGKQISSKRMTLHIYTGIFNVEIDFYYTALGPFYRSRVFMRIKIRMSFDCVHFACFPFFCIYTEKDIRRNWTKPPYVGLHLN